MNNAGNVEDALVTILDSMRKTKHSITEKSPHALHFGREPNTQLSNLHAKIVSDAKQLKRSLLTAEERKQHFYSKERLKVVRPRENSADGKFLFKPTVPDKLTATAIDAMSDLVAASEHWKTSPKTQYLRQMQTREGDSC